MRLCVCIPCFWGKLDPCEAIRRASALGYDAVETYQWKGLETDRVRAALAEHRVELMSMCTTDFHLTAPERQREWLQGLRESCDAARRLGVKRLITQVGADTGEKRSLQHASIVEGLKAARSILAESDVTLMIEPLNTLVDHKGYFLWSAHEGFEILREVDHPNVRMVYDIYHQQVMEGNILPSITQNMDLIAHLHCAGHPGRIEPWMGETNYRYVFDTLDAAGYRGACGLEYRPTLPAEESLTLAKQLLG